MAGNLAEGARQRRRNWSIARWAAAGLILLVPLVAMQFTDEVQWTLADFFFAGALLIVTGLGYELAARNTEGLAFRAAVAVALAAALILVWANAAVGIIGSADNDANLMYFVVVAIGIVGAVLARFQPLGMARALLAMALAQVLVTVIGLSAGSGSPDRGLPEISILNGFFVTLFLASAWLFKRASEDRRRVVP